MTSPSIEIVIIHTTPPPGSVIISVTDLAPKYLWKPPLGLHTRTLPQPVLLLVASFFDAQSLSRISSVSREWSRLASSNPHLWRALAVATARKFSFMGWPLLLHAGVAPEDKDPRQNYVARYKAAISVRNDRMAEHKADLVRYKQQTRDRQILCCSDVYLAPSIVCLSILLSSLVVWQLDQHHTVNLVSLWPVFAIITLLVTSITCFCFMRYRPGGACFISGGCFEKSRVPIVGCIKFIGANESRMAHGSFCAMLSCFALAIVLVVLRTAGTIQWNWWFVFSPFFVCFASFCWAPRLRWPDWGRGHYNMVVFWWIVLIAPLLCFTLLLAVRLNDPSSLKLSYVLIPLWFIDAVAFIISVFAVFDEAAFFMLIWICADAPCIVFKILLAVWIDSSPDWGCAAFVFIPLFFLQLVALWKVLVDSTNLWNRNMYLRRPLVPEPMFFPPVPV